MFQPSLTLSSADINYAFAAWIELATTEEIIANLTYKAGRGDKPYEISAVWGEEVIKEAINKMLNQWAGTNVQYDIALNETRDGWTAIATPLKGQQAAIVQQNVVTEAKSPAPVLEGIARAATVADTVLAVVPAAEEKTPPEEDDEDVYVPPFDIPGEPDTTQETAPRASGIFRRAPQS